MIAGGLSANNAATICPLGRSTRLPRRGDACPLHRPPGRALTRRADRSHLCRVRLPGDWLGGVAGDEDAFTRHTMDLPGGSTLKTRHIRATDLLPGGNQLLQRYAEPRPTSESPRIPAQSRKRSPDHASLRRGSHIQPGRGMHGGAAPRATPAAQTGTGPSSVLFVSPGGPLVLRFASQPSALDRIPLTVERPFTSRRARPVSKGPAATDQRSRFDIGRARRPLAVSRCRPQARTSLGRSRTLGIVQTCRTPAALIRAYVARRRLSHTSNRLFRPTLSRRHQRPHGIVVTLDRA